MSKLFFKLRVFMKPSLAPVAMTTNETARPPLDTFARFLLSSLGPRMQTEGNINYVYRKIGFSGNMAKGPWFTPDRKSAGERENNEEPNYCLLCNRNLLACSSWNNGPLHIDYAPPTKSAKRSPLLFSQSSVCQGMRSLSLWLSLFILTVQVKPAFCLRLSAPLTPPATWRISHSLLLSLVLPPYSRLSPHPRLARPGLASLGA